MLEFFPACLVILSTILVINVSLYTIQDISLLVIAREWIKGESTVISMFFFFWSSYFVLRGNILFALFTNRHLLLFVKVVSIECFFFI